MHVAHPITWPHLTHMTGSGGISPQMVQLVILPLFLGGDVRSITACTLAVCIVNVCGGIFSNVPVSLGK